MRKFMVAASLAIFALCARPAEARLGGNLGLGIQIGEPSAAISGKYWLSHMNAIDMAFGFSARNDWIMLQADYLWHHYNVIPVKSGELPLYYGMGATVVAADDPAVGIQGVVGLAYHFPAAALDVFLDLSPGAILIPDMHANVGVALGMRYYF